MRVCFWVWVCFLPLLGAVVVLQSWLRSVVLLCWDFGLHGRSLLQSCVVAMFDSGLGFLCLLCLAGCGFGL